MKYSISKGLEEDRLAKWLADAAKKYGTFEDGRVDYTHAPVAPVVMCTLYCQGKILLVKRGEGLADANGVWSTVNGFIDEYKPVKDQAVQEVKEELSLSISGSQVKVAASYVVQSSQEKRRYIIFPCLIVLNKPPKIKLDYENTDYAWINRTELSNYKTLDDLAYVIDAALAMLEKP